MSAGSGNHSKDPRSKLLSDGSVTRWVTAETSGSSRRLPAATGKILL
jgi:hypothetical protein